MSNSIAVPAIRNVMGFLPGSSPSNCCIGRGIEFRRERNNGARA